MGGEMKEWFGYEYGYVNLDELHIYLTHTGNWSEIETLKEKGQQKSSTFRKYSVLIFLICTAILFSMLYINNLMSNTLSVILLIVIPIAYYFLFQYMKTEIGPSYKLPISKLKKITFNANSVVLHFINGKEESDTELLKNVQSKGITILKSLQQNRSL
jgi:hypothetical protein